MEPFFRVVFVCARITMFSLPAFSVLETMDSRAPASLSPLDRMSSVQAGRVHCCREPGTQQYGRCKVFFLHPRTRVYLRKDQEKRKEIGKSELPKRHSFPLEIVYSIEQDGAYWTWTHYLTQGDEGIPDVRLVIEDKEGTLFFAHLSVL